MAQEAQVSSTLSLRACYAMLGTDTEHGSYALPSTDWVELRSQRNVSSNVGTPLVSTGEKGGEKRPFSLRRLNQKRYAWASTEMSVAR